MSISNQTGKKIEKPLLLFGLLTSTMLLGVVWPDIFLLQMFGVEPMENVSNFIARSWFGAIGVIGCLMILGAVDKGYRLGAVFMATASKMIFLILIFTLGGAWISQLLLTIIIDSAFVIYAAYWYGLRFIPNPARTPPKSAD